MENIINKEKEFPIYAKVTVVSIGLVVLIAALYIAQSIIIPLVFATIIAIVLHPVVKFFTRIRVNRVLSIIIALFITFLFIAGLGFLIFSQASRLSESWPVLVEKFMSVSNQTITWVSGAFDIDPQNIHLWITKTKADLLYNSNAAFGQTLINVGSGLIILFLVPVYIFMILYYYPILIEFVHRLFRTSNQSRLGEIISQIKTIIQRYLIGLLIEFLIIAVLYSIALLVLGIDYAILLGIIGALLNLIPYLGGIVGVALPMMVAIATKSSPWFALYVLISYYLIQLVDNNFIVPKIVASRVKINALFSIIAVIAGGALWGIAGMFLSIPLLAIVKLICDHIEPLKPWGFLLGDTMPSFLELKPILKRVKKKSP